MGREEGIVESSGFLVGMRLFRWGKGFDFVIGIVRVKEGRFICRTISIGVRIVGEL